jgi:uncharacterized protein YcbK (DUF882 family)
VAGKLVLTTQAVARLLFAALMALTMLLPPSAMPANAASGERTLYLYHTHTKETGRFTFKRNGRYDQQVLRQLNAFLADWRTKEATQMDPALFDLLWLVYQEVGANQPISIVSSYRTPRTNAMLRAKSSAVAENSQHMKGKAMDFYIPGVSLPKLRAVAMKYQVGGVGYYPTSGSPFVHLDTGSVRAWPRMTRAQLIKIFPDGRTLHIPADGKPISNDGRRYAELQWQQCHMVPCNGAPSVSSGKAETMLASNDAPQPATPGQNLLALIFGGGKKSAPEPLPDMQVASAEPTQRVVETVAITAPVPVLRPGTQLAGIASTPLAPVPAQKSAAILLATGPSIPANDEETALVALANIDAPMPVSREHPASNEDTMVTAYVPAMTPDPGAQRALQMIIERETTASVTPLPVAPKPELVQIQTASLGPDKSGLDVIGQLLEQTWNAVSTLAKPPLAAALQARVARQSGPAFETRTIELYPPDIDHVAETMVQPVAMSNVFFGELYEPEGYLEKTTELGAMSTQVGFSPDPSIPAYSSFVTTAPLLVATR